MLKKKKNPFPEQFTRSFQIGSVYLPDTKVNLGDTQTLSFALRFQITSSFCQHVNGGALGDLRRARSEGSGPGSPACHSLASHRPTTYCLTFPAGAQRAAGQQVMAWQQTDLTRRDPAQNRGKRIHRKRPAARRGHLGPRGRVFFARRA